MKVSGMLERVSGLAQNPVGALSVEAAGKILVQEGSAGLPPLVVPPQIMVMM
jgi:hypothetical protein